MRKTMSHFYYDPADSEHLSNEVLNQLDCVHTSSKTPGIFLVWSEPRGSCQFAVKLGSLLKLLIKTKPSHPLLTL